MPPANPLLVSTRNVHKVGEIPAILGPAFDIRDLSTIPPFPEVEETGNTFEHNATLKAIAASLLVDEWVIADDSGLEVDALHGAPGVLSARFAGTPSNDVANNALLLEKLAAIRGKARSARFRCVIVLARHGRKLAVFAGTVKGQIIPTPRGNAGFGYDPLFVPDGFCQSFAELPPETKNTLSHRAHAVAALKAWGGW